MTYHSENRDEREQQLDAIIAKYSRLEEKGHAGDQTDLVARYSEFRQGLNLFFAEFRMLNAASRQDREETVVEQALPPVALDDVDSA